MKDIEKDINFKNKKLINLYILNNKEENNIDYKIKLGEFILTPLECFLLNKKIPKGFKLETEENIFKELKGFKKQKNKINKLEKFEDKKINKTFNFQNNEIKINKERIEIGKNIDDDANNSSEPYKIMMKCYNGFNKIKSNPNSNFFYFSKLPNSPSLSNIEKKIKNYDYKSINDFSLDLRKLWNYQFKNHAKEPNIYQNICKMSLLSEEICKELSNEIEINKEDISTIKKRTEKIKKDLEKINVNLPPSIKKINNIQNKKNKQRTVQEINHLGSLIRTLNKHQLRGIIPILSDKKENKNVKIFEFDIEQLSPEKFRNLEKYVEDCINKKDIYKNKRIKKNENLKKYNDKNNNNLINNSNKKKIKSKEKIIKRKRLPNSDSIINNSSLLD